MDFTKLKRNEKAIFHHINQADKDLTRYACTIYSLGINLAYNTGIVIPESELEFIVKRQADRGLLELKAGGSITDAKEAFLEYLKENKDKYPQEVVCHSFGTQEKDFWEALELGYAVATGIKVNSSYAKDAHVDGILDMFEDYSEYKGNIAHYTNFYIWKSRFGQESQEHNKEFNLDSYFEHKDGNWNRIVDIKKIQENLLQNSAHFFYLKDCYK